MDPKQSKKVSFSNPNEQLQDDLNLEFNLLDNERNNREEQESSSAAVFAGPSPPLLKYNLRIELPGISQVKWNILSQERTQWFERYDYCVDTFTASLGVSPFLSRIRGEAYHKDDKRAFNNVNARIALRKNIDKNGFVQSLVHHFYQFNMGRCVWFVLYENSLIASNKCLQDDPKNFVYYMKQVSSFADSSLCPCH